MKRTPLKPGKPPQRKAPMKRRPAKLRPSDLRRSPLRTSGPMKRGAPMKRGKRLRPVNPERRAAEFARCYGSEARAEFVQSLHCCICGRVPSENAHVKVDGMGRKADARFVVPLCREHHAAQEGRTAAFELERRLPAGFLLDAAAQTERLWQARLARSAEAPRPD